MNIVCGMQSPHPYYGGMQYQSMSTATGGSSIGLGQYSAGASGGLTSTTTTGSNKVNSISTSAFTSQGI